MYLYNGKERRGNTAVGTMLRRTSILTLMLFSACGGSSGGTDRSNVLMDVTGRWSGEVERDAERSCVPPADQSVDLNGRRFTFDVQPLRSDGLKVVVDQDGVHYEQYYQNGITDGEFSVNSTAQDFTQRTPTGPTAVNFLPNDGETADVEVLVSYNRFCTVYFRGEFEQES